MTPSKTSDKFNLSIGWLLGTPFFISIASWLVTSKWNKTTGSLPIGAEVTVYGELAGEKSTCTHFGRLLPMTLKRERGFTRWLRHTVKSMKYVDHYSVTAKDIVLSQVMPQTIRSMIDTPCNISQHMSWSILKNIWRKNLQKTFPKAILRVSTSTLIMQVTSRVPELSTISLLWLVSEVDQVKQLLSIHLVRPVTEKVRLAALVVVLKKQDWPSHVNSGEETARVHWNRLYW